jgi:hypothetical protein
MPNTIYLKTDLGRNAFKDRALALTQRQRAAFILFDGIRTQAVVLSATAGLGVQSVDIAALVHHGYVVAVQTAAQTSSTLMQSALPSSRSLAALDVTTVRNTAQQRYQRAYPLAAQLTAGLGLRGFRLHMAVEAASGYEELLALAPKIRAAVGVDKCLALDSALAS